MIKGIGNDIIAVDRICDAIKRQGNSFFIKLFTARELEYCLKYTNSNLHIAGRFAAKEAIAKALGTGFGKNLSWQDIEILNDCTGKPYVTFSRNIQKSFNNPIMLISISHCDDYATAVAIWTN